MRIAWAASVLVGGSVDALSAVARLRCQYLLSSIDRFGRAGVPEEAKLLGTRRGARAAEWDSLLMS